MTVAVGATSPLTARASPSSWARRLVDVSALALCVIFIGAYALALGPDRDASGPVRDAGAYSYVGRIIASGGVPYLDAWDSKGPVLHLAHALSYWLPGAPWVAYIVVLNALLLASSLILHHQLSRLTTRFASLAAIAIGLAALSSLSHPGLAEPLAASFQMLALAAFLAYVRRRDRWLLCGVGASIGAVSLIRLDLAALPLLLAFAALLLTPWRMGWRAVTLLALGALLTAGPVLAWLHWHGAVPAMIEQSLGYNSFHHIDRSLTVRLLSAASLTTTLVLDTLLGVMALIGWGLALRQVWPLGERSGAAIYAIAEADGQPRAATVVLLTLLAAFAAGFVLSFTSGRAYDHYLVRLAPMGMVLTAGTLHALWRGGGFERSPARPAVVVLAAALCLAAFGPHMRAMSRDGPEDESGALIAYLLERTQPAKPLLVYGADGWIYNRTGTVAPSRYFYLYPLIARGYTEPALVEEFLTDLQRRTPRLIVDMPNPRLTPIAVDSRLDKVEEGYLTDTVVLAPVRRWIRDQYRIERRFSVADGEAVVWGRRTQP